MIAFKTVLIVPLPADIRPNPLTYNIQRSEDADKPGLVITINQILAKRVEDLHAMLRIYFPTATNIDSYELPVEEIDTDALVGEGFFTADTMRVLVPATLLIDIQRLLAIPGEDREYVRKEIANKIASLLFYTTGDAHYINVFAEHMERKMRHSGRSGWQNEEFTLENVKKRIELAVVENDATSAANYAMMLFFKMNPVWQP